MTLHKYRIVKFSNKPYYTLEKKRIRKHQWQERLERWEWVDVNESLDNLESKALYLIEEEKNAVEMKIIKEF